MITITFEPQTPEQAALVGQFLQTYMAPAPAAEAPKKPKAAKPAPTPPAEEPAPVEAAAPAPAAESPSKTVTLVEVRAKLAELGQAGKGDAVKAMLVARGVQKLSDLPPEQFSAVLTEAEAL